MALPENVLPGLIEKYVIRYNHTLHSEIGCTPFEKWMAGLGVVHGLNVPREIVSEAIRIRQEVTVERDGVHLYGLHYMAEELVGLVGEKVIVRTPVDATAEAIECFSMAGASIGLLRPVDHDRDLAGRINAARLARTVEIQSLAKTLREIATGVPEPEAEPPSPQAAPATEIPIRPSPKLPTEE